jgi:hypothetical protein
LVAFIYLGYFVYLNYNRRKGNLNINQETNKPSKIAEEKIPYENTSLWCFVYKDYKYLVINSYTGAAQCCSIKTRK